MLPQRTDNGRNSWSLSMSLVFDSLLFLFLLSQILSLKIMQPQQQSSSTAFYFLHFPFTLPKTKPHNSLLPGSYFQLQLKSIIQCLMTIDLSFHFCTPVLLHTEKAMALHSSALAWRIPWMEEPGRLQSMGSRRVGHDWATSFSFSLSRIGEGNGNPLQCSCLENPRDGGAWWTAVYGVTQSRTRLKQLSSSISSCCIHSEHLHWDYIPMNMLLFIWPGVFGTTSKIK